MNRTLTRPQAMGLLLIAAIAWGGMFPLAKALLHHMDAFGMTAIRYGTAALLFLATLRWREGRDALRLGGAGPRLWLYGTLGFAGFNLLAYVGIAHTRPEHAAVMVALTPLITAVIQGLRIRRRPDASVLLAIALALCGVVLVIGDGGALGRSGGGVGGDILVFLGAVCWVLYTLGAQRFPGWSPLRYTALSCALGAASIVAIDAALVGLGLAHLPSAHGLRESAWGIVYLVVVAAFVAVLGWNAGIRRIGAQGGVLFINLVPVTAMVIGALQGHPVGAGEIVGAGMVMAALVLNSVAASPGAIGRLLRRPRPGVCPS